VKIDNCPKTNFDAKVRLAAIMCGGNYTVFYEASTKRWAALGPNSGLPATGDNISAAKNPGPAPVEKVIVIWGLSLIVDEKSQVLLGDGTAVGHLVHLNTIPASKPAQAPKPAPTSAPATTLSPAAAPAASSAPPSQ
jgi:hypothetical protein